MDADKAQLARLRDRIAESKMNFDAWAGEVEDSMLSTRTQHVERVATDKENLDALRAAHNDALRRGKQTSKQAAEQATEVAQRRKEIESVAASEDALSSNVSQAQAERDALQRQKETLLAELDALKEAATERHSNIDLGAKYYKEHLGWRLRTRENDVLGMVFTRVDPADASREFSFNLRVRSDNTYTVESVRPAVQGYEADLELLNESNNLARFIQSMRRRFVDLC